MGLWWDRVDWTALELRGVWYDRGNARGNGGGNGTAVCYSTTRPFVQKHVRLVASR